MVLWHLSILLTFLLNSTVVTFVYFLKDSTMSSESVTFPQSSPQASPVLFQPTQGRHWITVICCVH